MFKKLSIRWRLTILSALLLTICCIGLTLVLNYSTFRLVDQIDAATLTTPAIESEEPQNNADNQLAPNIESFVAAEDLQSAKRGFSVQSILYMLLFVIVGSALTYYISGKALKPLDSLNGQVKNLSVHNLSESLIIPPTKDEIAELTQSFNEMTCKLDNAFAMQKRFSASAAHELRTPLAVLQTKIDVFKKKTSHTNAEYEGLISVFEKQITRLRGLINNLLDLTNKVEDKEKSLVNLQDILEDIVSELSTVANKKKVSLSLSCDSVTVFGNIDLLYRAFYNLIENGINYNIEGGTIHIDVSQTSKDQVKIAVKDSGIGISEEMKKHIFEPFYRVEKSRSRAVGGVGLGLSFVDAIVKSHDGNVTVTDNKDSGTCFSVTLNNTSSPRPNY